MGLSKALMEKLVVASRGCVVRARRYFVLRAMVTSWLRGSVIQLFFDLIKAGKPLTVTDPEMTRFLMSLKICRFSVACLE